MGVMAEIPYHLEFRANYPRFTPEMTDSLGRIAQALGAIRGARILPAISDQLRVSARVGTVHYSTLIEGNELPLLAAERAARGKLAPDSRAKIELINYVAALDLIDANLDRAATVLTPGFLKELHGATTSGLGRTQDPHFKPHHEGEWRDGVALVVDRISGKVMHEGPPPDEVEPRVMSLFDWMERKLRSGEPPYIVAGVVHYGITDIHPFADGNGRVARLLTAAVLMKAGMMPERMFSFERYYADDRAAYYAALRSVRERTMNMQWWLEYFLRGLVEEYERVAVTVADLDTLATGGGSSALRLSVAQQNALAQLRLRGREEFTRREYEDSARLGRTSAGEDIRDLVKHGILTVRGSGTKTRYAFAGTSTATQPNGKRRGPASIWTDAHIEAELRAFLADRTSWPPRSEFEATGRKNLYLAAS